MGRTGILQKDTAMFITYDEYENPTQYMRCQIIKLANDLGLTYKSLVEYISRKRHLKDGAELYKLTNDNKLIKLI